MTVSSLYTTVQKFGVGTIFLMFLKEVSFTLQKKNTVKTVILLNVSAVKGLIASQNFSFCLHNMCVYCVYLLCVYKYKHMHVYISEKKLMFIY